MDGAHLGSCQWSGKLSGGKLSGGKLSGGKLSGGKLSGGGGGGRGGGRTSCCSSFSGHLELTFVTRPIRKPDCQTGRASVRIDGSDAAAGGRQAARGGRETQRGVSVIITTLPCTFQLARSELPRTDRSMKTMASRALTLLLLHAASMAMLAGARFVGPRVQTTTLAPLIAGWVPPFSRPMQPGDALPSTPYGNITLYIAPNMGLDGPLLPSPLLRRRDARAIPRAAFDGASAAAPAANGTARARLGVIRPLRSQGRALLGAPRVTRNTFELLPSLPGQTVDDGFSPRLVGRWRDGGGGRVHGSMRGRGNDRGAPMHDWSARDDRRSSAMSRCLRPPAHSPATPTHLHPPPAPAGAHADHPALHHRR